MVRLELPGVDVAKDVNVEVDRGHLVIHGERRDEHADEDPGKDGRTLREVRYGSFRRSFEAARACHRRRHLGVLRRGRAHGTGGRRPQGRRSHSASRSRAGNSRDTGAGGALGVPPDSAESALEPQMWPATRRRSRRVGIGGLRFVVTAPRRRIPRWWIHSSASRERRGCLAGLHARHRIGASSTSRMWCTSKGSPTKSGIDTVSGTFDDSEVRITAYTSTATRISGRHARSHHERCAGPVASRGSSSPASHGREPLCPALQHLLGPP